MSLKERVNQILQLHGFIFNDHTKDRFQKISIQLAIFGFLLHLLLIYLRQADFIHFSRGNELLQRPLQALYTPFSFILFEEIYLLLGYITYSFSKSIVTQFEIITLFILRGIFKDISTIDLSFSNKFHTDLVNFLYNLAALVLLIVLVAFIRRRISEKEQDIKRSSLQTFIAYKKWIVLALVFILVGVASFDLVGWATDQFKNDPNPIKSVREVNTIFYKEFFIIMIFVDVLILLISLRFTNNYDILLRNSGYILSTVILRIAMTSSTPYSSVGYVLSGSLCLFFVIIFTRFSKGEVKDGSELVNAVSPQ